MLPFFPPSINELGGLVRSRALPDERDHTDQACSAGTGRQSRLALTHARARRGAMLWSSVEINGSAR